MLHAEARSACAGTIPEAVWTNAGLSALHLDHNYKLNGSLPTAPLASSVLQLDLQHNSFAGTIPASINSPESQLEVRCRRHSRFLHGVLRQGRAEQVMCTSQMLDLSHNQLTGTLPPELVGDNGGPICAVPPTLPHLSV